LGFLHGTFLVYSSYAVRVQTGRLTRWKPDSPAAAWYVFFFFTNILHVVQNVREKDMGSSALPVPALSVVEWGDIPRQTRERLIHGSIGCFTCFAHFVVFVVQTPTA
jgi:hypothetical protein